MNMCVCVVSVCLFVYVQHTTKMSHLLMVHVLSRWPIFRQDVHKCACVLHWHAYAFLTVERAAKMSIFCWCVLWSLPTCRQEINVYICYIWYIYGAWTTFSHIDLTISIKYARPTSSCFVKALPLSLRFSVSPVIRLLQAGACSVSQVPGGFLAP